MKERDCSVHTTYAYWVHPDAHMKAFERLEALGIAVYVYDACEVACMLEQMVCEE